LAPDVVSSAAMSQPSAEAMDRVAQAALAMVSDGMRLGLGTGRAAEAFIRALGTKVAAGLSVRCVTTSNRSEELAQHLGIPLGTVEDVPELDLAFDGADEFTASLDLTKGLGGALLRERVVAVSAARFIVLVTPEKRVDRLGTRAPIPVEVVPFATAPVERGLRRLGAEPVLRRTADGAVYRTDNGNVILDARVAPLERPEVTHAAIRALPGVVDTGLFLGMASVVLIGAEPLERLDRA
jgi:ribose 5-phosphate isomerase A